MAPATSLSVQFIRTDLLALREVIASAAGAAPASSSLRIGMDHAERVLDRIETELSRLERAVSAL